MQDWSVKPPDLIAEVNPSGGLAEGPATGGAETLIWAYRTTAYRFDTLDWAGPSYSPMLNVGYIYTGKAGNWQNPRYLIQPTPYGN
jgi:hypothetical protein